MTHTVYRFHLGRLVRNIIGPAVLLAFPVALHLTGHSEPAFFFLFGGFAAAFAAWVIFTASRFKLTVGAEGLTFRGRIRTHRINYADIRSAEIRRGRDKAARFMGPPPFRELVLTTVERRLVISSLPLGAVAFDEVLTHLSNVLPETALDGSS